MSHHKLVYDDRCAFCCAAVRHLKRRQFNRPLDLVGLSSIGRHGDLSCLSPNRLRAEIHLVTDDGRVYAGAAALARVARMTPRYRWLGIIMSLPLIRQLADMVYRRVAERRHSLTPLVSIDGMKNSPSDTSPSDPVNIPAETKERRNSHS